MNAAEEKTVLSGKPMTLGASKHRALTLVLFLLAALIALASGLAGPTSASAKTSCALQNRVWENSAGTAQSPPIQMPQSLELQRENSIGRYNDASGCTLAAESATESRAIISYYPPNQGFVGEPAPASLVPRSIVDRSGGTGGSYLSPQGTPAWARSLPFGAETKTLNSFEVLKPIDVTAGPAAPWFNQPGGGIQYDLGTNTVQDLIDSGHLRQIP